MSHGFSLHTASAENRPKMCPLDELNSLEVRPYAAKACFKAYLEPLVIPMEASPAIAMVAALPFTIFHIPAVWVPTPTAVLQCFEEGEAARADVGTVLVCSDRVVTVALRAVSKFGVVTFHRGHMPCTTIIQDIGQISRLKCSLTSVATAVAFALEDNRCLAVGAHDPNRRLTQSANQAVSLIELIFGGDVLACCVPARWAIADVQSCCARCGQRRLHMMESSVKVLAMRPQLALDRGNLHRPRRKNITPTI